MLQTFGKTVRSWRVFKLIMNDVDNWDYNACSLVLQVHHTKRNNNWQLTDGDGCVNDTTEIILTQPLKVNPSNYQIACGDVVVLPAGCYRIARKEFSSDPTYYIWVAAMHLLFPQRSAIITDEPVQSADEHNSIQLNSLNKFKFKKPKVNRNKNQCNDYNQNHKRNYVMKHNAFNRSLHNDNINEQTITSYKVMECKPTSMFISYLQNSMKKEQEWNNLSE